MALDLDALQVFVKVAELGSFTRAAQQLGLRKAQASLRLKALEQDLGRRLLHRSTRAVRLTGDGEALLPQARVLLEDAERIGAAFSAARSLSGRVRVDMPVGLATSTLVPKLPLLLDRYPRLEVFVSTTDRLVEPVREGFDCVLRVGRVRDSELAYRPLGQLPMVSCASPAYLKRHGVPQQLSDLSQHLVVHYATAFEGDVPGFDYLEGDEERTFAMRSAVTVNGTDAYRSAGEAGLGIIQAPSFGPLRELLASGDMVEVLPQLQCPALPVSLLHTHRRNVPERVRVVMDFITETLTPHLRAK